jgi:hypothetical protein
MFEEATRVQTNKRTKINSFIFQNTKHDIEGLIVAVDFDGTLVGNDYPDIVKININEKLIEQLIRFREKGGYIILWTCREGRELDDAVNFCKKRGLVFDKVNDNLDHLQKAFSNNPRKIYADVYIDDHAFYHTNLSGWAWE